MDNDCVAPPESRQTPEAYPDHRRAGKPCWAWLYEFRPPTPAEAISCAAGGLQQAGLLHSAASPEAAFDGSALIETFLQAGDPEAACAATLLGLTSVLEAGRDFREFNTWLLRGEALLAQPGLSLLGRSALLMYTAIAQLLGPGQLGDVLLTLETFSELAEAADSDAQRIIHASLRGYCELMSGRMQVADAIVRDALHISPAPGSQAVPKLHLQATLGLINTLRNNLGDARECLETLTGDPAFDRLPASLWLICMGHRLLSLAVAGDRPTDLEAVAERIRARSIPTHKHYHRSYTHYALGAAALLGGQPEAALFHAETAVELARRCHSAVAERTSRLLVIQARADLGQHERALAALADTQEAWKAAGAHLLLASGALEEVRLRLETGHPEIAQAALGRAREALPKGEAWPCNLRRQSSISALLERLTSLQSTPAGTPADRRPVQITTFGELCVEINGKRLYDRDWHGTRTKTLLKALIVLGGYKVSANRLCDLLWPDTDGDLARNNLKVTLWRLRHLGCAKGETPLPWVVVQHGHVSLVAGMCRIDSIEFEESVKAALASADHASLSAILAPVTADFLADDDSEPWIAPHRADLRNLYLRGACALAQNSSEKTGMANTLRILEYAIALAPDSERCRTLLAQFNARKDGR